MSSSLPGTDLGTPSAGTSTVLGSLDGGTLTVVGSDEQDALTFTLTSSATIDLSSTGVGTVLFLFDSSSNFIGAGFDGAGVFGTLSAGTYGMSLDPSGNTGQSSYTLSFNVAGVAPVPLPATGLMLMGGLGGLAALRRRRRRS